MEQRPKPSISFSNSGRMASMVTSSPVRPVPPVVMITSMSSRLVQSRTTWRMARTSSLTTLRAESAWPASAMRSASVWPETSSSRVRVFEIVRMAILTGMKAAGLSHVATYLANWMHARQVACS